MPLVGVESVSLASVVTAESPAPSRQIVIPFDGHRYSPSAGRDTAGALELSDRNELVAGAASPVTAGADDGGGSESAIGGAPEAQPVTSSREPSTVAKRRFMHAPRQHCAGSTDSQAHLGRLRSLRGFTRRGGPRSNRVSAQDRKSTRLNSSH